MTGPVEFPRPFAVDALPAGGRAFAIAASAAECAAVARRLGLEALHRLDADGSVTPAGAGNIRLAGMLRALVVQTCVVTLEPFEAVIEAPFETIYSRAAGAGAGAGADDEDDGADDDGWAGSPAEHFYEPLTGDVIDLGEAVTQQLALELDPYPRKPGAVLPEPAPESPPEPADRGSPFAVLRGRR